MQTIAPSPVNIINLDTPNSIWEHIKSGNKIQYFDFGTGQLTSIKQVVVKLAGLMGCSNDLLSFDSKRDRDDSELISCAKKFLPGWKPQVSLEEGIINYLNSLEI